MGISQDNLFKMDDFGVPPGNSDMVSGSRARICAGFRGDDLCHLLGWHDDAHLGPRDVGLLEQPVRSMAWWCRIKAFWIFLDLFGSFFSTVDVVYRRVVSTCANSLSTHWTKLGRVMSCPGPDGTNMHCSTGRACISCDMFARSAQIFQGVPHSPCYARMLLVLCSC
jgi:hypothetical protein